MLRVMGVPPGPRELRTVINRFANRQAGCIVLPNEAWVAKATQWDLGPEIECLTPEQLVRRLALGMGMRPLPRANRKLRLEAWAAVAPDVVPHLPLRNLPRFKGLLDAYDDCLQRFDDFGFELGDTSWQQALPEDLNEKLGGLFEVRRAGQRLMEKVNRFTEPIRDQIYGLDGAKLPQFAERILFVAGAAPPPLWAEIAEQLNRVGADVWWVIEHDTLGRGLFQREALVSSGLGEIAQVAEAKGLAAALFSHQENYAGPLQIRVQTTSDDLAEVEWALRLALASLRSGIPADRIGIFARDLEHYGPLVDDAARRLGVPVRTTRRVPLLTNGFVRLVLGALKVLASKTVLDFASLLPSSYLRFSPSEIEELRTLIFAARRESENSWQTFEEGIAAKPEFATLTALLTWRKEALGQPANLALWGKRLREIMALWDADLLFGSVLTQQRDARAQTAMLRSITTLTAIEQAVGESSHTLGDFANLCERLWDQEDVSVPGGETGVLFASRAEEFDELDHLHILGMLEGQFPSRRRENPILSDQDLDEIEKSAQKMAPWNSHLIAAGERDEFVRLCSLPEMRLVLSYARTSDERDNVPAFYLEELRRVAHVEEVHLVREDWVPQGDEVLAKLDEELSQLLNSGLKPQPVSDSINQLSEELRNQLAWPENAEFFPRDLIDARECPFRFFTRRRLDLHGPTSEEYWYQLLSLPREAQLPRRANPIEARIELESKLLDWLEVIRPDVSSAEHRSLSAAGQRLIEGWLQREFAAREHYPRELVAASFPLDQEPLRNKPLGSSPLRLKGVVDALSWYRNKPLVTLYLARRRKNTDVTKFSSGGASQQNDLRSLFELGLYVSTAFRANTGCVIEIDGAFDNSRILFDVLASGEPDSYTMPTKDGIEFVTFCPGHDGRTDLAEIGRAMKVAMQEVEDSILNLRVQERSGTTCSICTVGELCRRHRHWGEREGGLFD